MVDFQKLLDLNFPFLEQHLKQYGTFFPFASAIDHSGEIQAILLDIDELFNSSPDFSVLDELQKELILRKEDFNASAMFYPIQDGDKEILAVALEHKTDREFVTLFYHYQLGDNGLEILDSWKEDKQAEIFI